LQQTSLPAFADGLLRVELRLLSMGLKRRRLDWVASWADNTATELHASFMRGLEVAEATILDAHDLEGLPRRLRAVYQLWRDGHDLRELYPKNTFYRHRRALLAHGIDVAIKQERTSPDLSNVVPLRVVLTAVPVSVPDWAEGTPLFFEPRQRFGT
jgi:II/X family phage/plasmid replication protein